MPTPNEIEVLQAISSIEVTPRAAAVIEQMGPDAVSLLCEIASGALPGLRSKVRTNAVALLGFMKHPQAKEAVRLLVSDANPNVATRAMRAAARLKLNVAVTDIVAMLNKPELSPLLAAEAVKALLAIDSAAARQQVESYRKAAVRDLPHRGSALVADVLSRGAT